MAGDADKEAFQRLDEKVEKIGESVIRLDTTVGNLAKSTDFLNETVKELLPLKGSITFHSSVSSSKFGWFQQLAISRW